MRYVLLGICISALAIAILVGPLNRIYPFHEHIKYGFETIMSPIGGTGEVQTSPTEEKQ